MEGLGCILFKTTIHINCFVSSWARTKTIQDTILRKANVTDTSHIFQASLDSYIQVCGSLPSAFSFGDTTPHLMRTLAVPYFETLKKKIPMKYHMTERDSVLWQCNKMKHTHDYLMDIPINGLNQSINPS